MSDFGEKLFPGVGYPTPVSIPEETTCFLMQVPASAEWWALVVGVLYTLTLEWNWQQFEGGLDRDVAAARWITMLDEAMALAEVGNECSAMVEAPYWDDDDADDADDEAPTDDQPWYGQLLTDGFTWQEQLSVWIVTAFVAYAATPAAAIAFLPVANQFVLEFKTGNLGGIVKIFVNASEVAQVDTYSATAGVIKQPLVLAGTGGMGAMDIAPTMWIVMSDEVNPAVTGAPNIQVLRKRLTPDEISPPNLRYDEDCNCIQQTYDGGSTWVDQPAADPRHADGFRRPARTDEDAKCNAAQGMSDYIRHTLANWIAAATLGQAATGILEILLLLAGGAGVLIDLIILALETLATIGEATVEAAFTDAVYDDLTCAFYCNIDSDGQMSADQLADFLAQVNDEHPGTVYNVVSTIANMTGEVLFSNAGVEGTETGDCSACACNYCYLFDFTLSNGGWESRTDAGGSGHDWGSTWNDGSGWTNTPTYISNSIRFQVSSDVSLTRVASTFTGNGVTMLYSPNADFSSGNVTIANMATSGTEYSAAGGTIPSGYWIGLFQSEGTLIATHRLRGTGSNPFGEDNC